MSNSINRLFVFVIVFILVGLVAIYVFVDRQTTFAQSVDKENNRYQIIGKSTDLIDGWSVAFCWRRANGPWMLYYLDHKSSRWTNAKIQLQPNKTIVLKDDKEVGYLNLEDGSFHSLVYDHVQPIPAKIVVDTDPFDKSAYVYPESNGWNSVWPSAMDTSVKK